MIFTESIVENATLNWFGELGYSLLHGQVIAPGGTAAERNSIGEVLLPEPLRAALRVALLSRELLLSQAACNLEAKA